MTKKINMRIAKASVELATAPQFDRIIENYDLDSCPKRSRSNWSGGYSRIGRGETKNREERRVDKVLRIYNTL